MHKLSIDNFIKISELCNFACFFTRIFKFKTFSYSVKIKFYWAYRLLHFYICRIIYIFLLFIYSVQVKKVTWKSKLSSICWLLILKSNVKMKTGTQFFFTQFHEIKKILSTRETTLERKNWVNVPSTQRSTNSKMDHLKKMML